MVFLISGSSHSGKTLCAQRLLEKYKYPYLSIDHLKMGLIRSGHTELTPLSDDGELTALLWPIVREIIKTVIENKQNLIVEGVYIPFDWQKDFSKDYLNDIKYSCIILSEKYLKEHISNVKKYANSIENRIDDNIDLEELIADNNKNLELAKKYKLNYVLIEKEYKIENIFD